MMHEEPTGPHMDLGEEHPPHTTSLSPDDALRDLIAEKRAVFSVLSDLTLLRINPDRSVVWCTNPGGSGSPLTDRPCHDIVFGRPEPCLQCSLETVIDTGKVVDEVHEPCEDGILRFRCAPIFGEDMTVTGAICSIMRLPQSSEKDQALARKATQLERSNEDLEQFAYIASHDLQEPLRKIRTFGKRLEAEFADHISRVGADYLNRMTGAAERMSELIDSLLMLSRVTTEAQPFERTDLNEVLLEVLTDIEVIIEMHRGIVVVDDLPVIEADRVQLRRLFQNLLTNSLKFHRPGIDPVISVKGTVTGTGPAICVLEFEDNGIGFEDKYVERLFQPFQRLHGRREYDGTGMGLTICRKIAERHGGKVTARGTSGEGAVFTVTLPVDHPAGRG